MRSGDVGEVARAGAGTTATPEAAIFWPAEGGRLGFEWPPPQGIMGVTERPRPPPRGFRQCRRHVWWGGAVFPPGGSPWPGRRRVRGQPSPAQPQGVGRAGPAGLLRLLWARQPRGEQVLGPLPGCSVGLTTAALRGHRGGCGRPGRPSPVTGAVSCGCLVAGLPRGLRKTGQLVFPPPCAGAHPEHICKVRGSEGAKPRGPLNPLRLRLAAPLAPVPGGGTPFAPRRALLLPQLGGGGGERAVSGSCRVWKQRGRSPIGCCLQNTARGGRSLPVGGGRSRSPALAAGEVPLRQAWRPVKSAEKCESFTNAHQASPSPGDAAEKNEARWRWYWRLAKHAVGGCGARREGLLLLPPPAGA